MASLGVDVVDGRRAVPCQKILVCRRRDRCPLALVRQLVLGELREHVGHGDLLRDARLELAVGNVVETDFQFLLLHGGHIDVAASGQGDIAAIRDIGGIRVRASAALVGLNLARGRLEVVVGQGLVDRAHKAAVVLGVPTSILSVRNSYKNLLNILIRHHVATVYLVMEHLVHLVTVIKGLLHDLLQSRELRAVAPEIGFGQLNMVILIARFAGVHAAVRRKHVAESVRVELRNHNFSTLGWRRLGKVGSRRCHLLGGAHACVVWNGLAENFRSLFFQVRYIIFLELFTCDVHSAHSV